MSVELMSWSVRPFHEDLMRRDSKNAYAKVSAAMLNRQLYFYPVQQSCLKNQVKLYVSHNLFSYPDFCSNFERLTEIYESSHKINLLFRLFQKFAENPSEGICHRLFWSSKNGYIPYELEGREYFLEVSRCWVTAEALMTSIFGIEIYRNVQRLQFEPTDVRGFRQLRQLIENHAHHLQTEKGSGFFAYSFGLNCGIAFPGHAFLVVQSLAESGVVQYRIYQSYIGEYCLKSYLDKGCITLSHEKFRVFLLNLEKLTQSIIWTVPLEKFYTSHFNLRKAFPVGKRNPCKGVKLFLEWGQGALSNIFEQMKKLDSFVSRKKFPSIEATCICCSKAERKHERLTEDELRELDQKLFDLYERDRFTITGSEYIQVDLDSLGLDLNEEAQIEVPKRDASGQLVMEGKEPVWVERTITLRKATKDVIGEINTLISELLAERKDKNSNIILVNTNQEPFASYHGLGLPDDLFFMAKGYEEKLWMRRIMNALVKNHYVKKLVCVNGHGYFIQIDIEPLSKRVPDAVRI